MTALPPLPEPEALGMDFDEGWDGVRAYGYTAEQMQAYAIAAIAAQGVQRYDQQALELCEVCGWKTLIPDDGCLNCERKPLSDQEIADAAPVNETLAHGFKLGVRWAEAAHGIKE